MSLDSVTFVPAACAVALACVYCSASFACARVDIRERRIPNALVAVVAAGAFVQMLLAGPFGLDVMRGLGAPPTRIFWAAGVLVLGTTAELLVRHLRDGVHAVGLGDVKFLAAQALWLGPLVLPALCLACLVALAVEGVFRRRRTFAFGPYIALASGTCLLVALLGQGTAAAAYAWC